ncbi:hypothetical protein GE061_006861 [Apolygus lucorum]|uniref:Uncharacterized protein n=1 Tax=Apolygus lucorum TaxID=248454 RepID=A0A6A4J8F5_APOLU|nr:hypothetical protein GE061_006861 [Apolygus lucorum]
MVNSHATNSTGDTERIVTQISHYTKHKLHVTLIRGNFVGSIHSACDLEDLEELDEFLPREEEPELDYDQMRLIQIRQRGMGQDFQPRRPPTHAWQYCPPGRDPAQDMMNQVGALQSRAQFNLSRHRQLMRDNQCPPPEVPVGNLVDLGGDMMNQVAALHKNEKKDASGQGEL